MASVTFRQRVVFKNARLHVLFSLLLIGAIVVVCVKFFILEAWSNDAFVEGHVRLRVQGQLNRTRLVDAYEAHQGSPFCASAGSFDSAQYANHTCINICTAGHAQAGCLHPSESAVSLPELNEVFMVTHIQDVYLGGSRGEQSFFVPSVEALSVAVQFNYREPPGAGRDQYAYWADMARVTSSAVRTVLLNKDMQPYRSVQPGEPIVLTVPEILELSGKNLDEEATSVIEGSSLINRIAGLTLCMEIDCYNAAYGNPDEENGRHCYLMMLDCNLATRHIGRQMWLGSDMLVVRNTGGINVRATLRGSVKEVDYTRLFFELVFAWTILQFPKRITLIIACFFLGNLSAVYFGAIYKKFKVEDQCGGMVARLLSNSVQFAKMCDVRQPDHQMSKSRLQTLLKDELERRQDKLDEPEVTQLVNFCFRSVMTTRRNAALTPRKSCFLELLDIAAEVVQEFLREILDELGMIDRGAPPKCESMLIGFDNFERTSSHDDPVNLDSFLKLFDGSRSRTCCEGALMPARLKFNLDDPEEIRTDFSMQRNISGGLEVGYGAGGFPSDRSQDVRSASTSSWAPGRGDYQSYGTSSVGTRGSRTSRASLSSMQRRQQNAEKREQVLALRLEEMETSVGELQKGVQALGELLRQRQDFLVPRQDENGSADPADSLSLREISLKEECAAAQHQAELRIRETVALESQIKTMQDHMKKCETSIAKTVAENKSLDARTVELERSTFVDDDEHLHDEHGHHHHHDDGTASDKSTPRLTRDESTIMKLTPSLKHLQGGWQRQVTEDDDDNDPYEVRLEGEFSFEGWDEAVHDMLEEQLRSAVEAAHGADPPELAAIGFDGGLGLAQPIPMQGEASVDTRRTPKGRRHVTF